MTVNDVFDSVIAMMFADDTDKADFQPNFSRCLNIVLAECFNLNNNLRKCAGKDPLSDIPYVTELTDEIGYEPILERVVLPYGAAAILYVDDDETGVSNVYREKYEALRESSAVCLNTPIVDAW